MVALRNCIAATISCLMLAAVVKGQIISGESVVLDAAHDRYLASDQASGIIRAVDYEGGMTFFASAPPATKGIMIRNDTVFCAASTSGLVLFDLETGSEILRMPFPGMNNLNDVIGDTSGNIYVSDAQGNKVHKLDLGDLSTELVLDDFAWANGMVFDTAHNRILICQWITYSPITAINLDDYSTEIIRDDGLSRLDGLAGTWMGICSSPRMAREIYMSMTPLSRRLP
jgi:sugar lactone lactonase YvrE